MLQRFGPETVVYGDSDISLCYPASGHMQKGRRNTILGFEWKLQFIRCFHY